MAIAPYNTIPPLYTHTHTMSRALRLPLSALLLLASALNAVAHDGHDGHDGHQIVVAPDADWATRHMAGMHALTAPDLYVF
jgi:hypothetical protein